MACRATSSGKRYSETSGPERAISCSRKPRARPSRGQERGPRAPGLCALRSTSTDSRSPSCISANRGRCASAPTSPSSRRAQRTLRGEP
eukprot:2580113-Alexandrium_andersonii.AAC.1